jgi:signal transduction histidine kinase
MIARLEQSWERERRFVSDASHELRTPIAVIKTELEAAAGADADPRSVAESIRAAIDECDGLAQLADDLLTLSRADEAGLQLSCGPLAVRPLLADVRNRFLDRATRHARQIVIKADPGLDVVADEVRIRQALSNLVDNALRHGAGTICLGATADQQGIHLEVSDEGPGFSPSLAEQALGRFVRGEKARAARGAGLGLAIVHTIMSAHGGEVEVVAGQPAAVRLSVPPAAADTSPRDRRPGLNTAAATQRPVEPPRGCSS